MSQSSGTSSGIVWAFVSQGGRIVLQLALVAVLSRILPPEDFGLLAMATVVTVLASLIRDMGTAAAVIQTASLSQEMLETTFWFNVVVGLALAFILAACAFPAALAFREPRLAGVLTALSVTFPVTSLGAVHQALLERKLRFRSLARIELGSPALALLVAVAAARAGCGVYSLVLNSVCVSVLTSGQLWLTSGWRPRFRWDPAGFRGIWKFGGNLFGFQMLNYLARNADSILIGRVLGAVDLGWYNMAYRIMLFPLTTFSTTFSRVMFPVLSRNQGDPASFRQLYLRAVSIVALITAPLMAGLWILRVSFVEVLLGSRWIPVATILGWFAPVGFIQSIVTTVGLVYMGTGNTRLMFRWGAAASTAIVLAICIGLHWGYLGVARAYAMVMLCLVYPAFAIPLRLIGVPVTRLFFCIWRPLVCASIMAVVVVGLDRVTTTQLAAVSRLLLLSSAGAVTYLAAAGVIMRPLIQDLLRSFFHRNVSAAA